MTTTASRFAVLKIDDDDDVKAMQRRAAQQNHRPGQAKALAAEKEKEQALAVKKAAKKQQQKHDKAELLALAFGGSKPRKGQSAGKKKTSQPSSTTGGAINDAVWQKRDEQFVDDTYRRQLEEALAASKIDYEREKMEAAAKLAEAPAAVPPKKGRKGVTTMSLDQFNLPPPPVLQTTTVLPKQEEDEDFFAVVDREANQVVEKERKRPNAKKASRIEGAAAPAPVLEPRLAQLVEELSLRDEQLRLKDDDNERLRRELADVKQRNRKLCQILVQGEMKDKAQLLVELDELARVRDELTAEVDRLNAELQQQRSRLSALDAKKSSTAQKK